MTEPMTKAALWRRFLLWVIGVPVVVVAAGAVIWGVLWLSGGDLVWQAVQGMGTSVFWVAAIVLMYPAMIWVWWGELQDGLKAAAAWEAMSLEERMASQPRVRGKKAGSRR